GLVRLHAPDGARADPAGGAADGGPSPWATGSGTDRGTGGGTEEAAGDGALRGLRGRAARGLRGELTTLCLVARDVLRAGVAEGVDGWRPVRLGDARGQCRRAQANDQDVPPHRLSSFGPPLSDSPLREWLVSRGTPSFAQLGW